MKFALACVFALVLFACGGSSPGTASTVTLDASVAADEVDGSADVAESSDGSVSTDESASASAETEPTATATEASPTTASTSGPSADDSGDAEDVEDDSVAAASTPRASGATDIVADGSLSFSTPSGNMTCSIAEQETFCHISDKDWEIDAPPGCTDDYGNVVFVAPSGPFFGCYTDLFWDTDAEPLAYGSTATVGDMRCLVEQIGVTCVNRSDNGFRIARAAVELF